MTKFSNFLLITFMILSLSSCYSNEKEIKDISTKDNFLKSAYMTFTCFDSNNKELFSHNIDADSINLDSGKLSEKIDFVPPLISGNKVIVKFKALSFKNSKDDWSN